MDMETNGIISSSLALLAIVLSCVALFFSWKYGRTQNEVNLIEIEKNKEVKDAQKKAFIKHELVSDGKSHRFQLSNTGLSEARNVNIEFVEENNFIIGSEVQEKLPVKKLGAGESISMIAAISTSTKPQQEINICWEDDTNENNKRNVTISVFG
jgi:hypothetical protein